MSELKAGVMRTPHNEGMIFDRGSSRIAVTEDETEFYLKSEVDQLIAEKDTKIIQLEALIDNYNRISERSPWRHCAEIPEIPKSNVIAGLKAENERLEKFADELIKDCKWLYTNHTPAKNGFETIVICTNGKKRVAEFRAFDLRWYDVNNGNKLNVVKWLWQPRMPNDEKKYNDELRRHKYKRCLAMAKWCFTRSNYFFVVGRSEGGRFAEEIFRRSNLYSKWCDRWKKLAEQFKKAK